MTESVFEQPEFAAQVRDQGFILLDVNEATDMYRIVYEIQATDAGRAALQQKDQAR